MSAVNITDENFDQLIINPGKTVLIDFGAEWCPPCKAMSPVLEFSAKEFEGKALVGKLDADSNPLKTARYGVRNLPTFLFFKDGHLIDRIVGAVPKSTLEQKLISFL